MIWGEDTAFPLREDISGGGAEKAWAEEGQQASTSREAPSMAVTAAS